VIIEGSINMVSSMVKMMFERDNEIWFLEV